MNQPLTQLSARNRALVALGAAAVLAVITMLQCPALVVEASARSAITMAATLLAALCAAVLIEDLVVHPLRAAWRLPAWLASGR